LRSKTHEVRANGKVGAGRGGMFTIGIAEEVRPPSSLARSPPGRRHRHSFRVGTASVLVLSIQSSRRELLIIPLAGAKQGDGAGFGGSRVCARGDFSKRLQIETVWIMQ